MNRVICSNDDHNSCVLKIHSLGAEFKGPTLLNACLFLHFFTFLYVNRNQVDLRILLSP